MSTDRNDLGSHTSKIDTSFNPNLATTPSTKPRFGSHPPLRTTPPDAATQTTPYSVYTYSQSNQGDPENGTRTLNQVLDDQQILKTMQSLHRACRLARSCNRPDWDFALDVHELRFHGVGSADLRWLMAIGWVEHRLEVTEEQQPNRHFEKNPGFKIGDSSCFQLTEVGKELAAELAHSADQQTTSLDSTATSQPSWDCIRHELRLGNRLVKKFKWRAQNQEAILSAFEEEEWPPRIDDPLPPVQGKNPKRRLSDAIKCLNRHQNLSLIRFSGDGTGEGVLWERVDPVSH